VSDESKRKRNETPEFSTQDLGKRLRQILEDVNAYQVILRRMDGTTIISLPALIALVAVLIMPRLVVLIFIAHVLNLLKVAISRRD